MDKVTTRVKIPLEVIETLLALPEGFRVTFWDWEDEEKPIEETKQEDMYALTIEVEGPKVLDLEEWRKRLIQRLSIWTREA